MNSDSNIVPLALQPPDPQIVVRPVRLDDLQALRAGCWSQDALIASRKRLIRIVYAMEQGSGLGLMICGVQDHPLGYGQWVRHHDYAEISDVFIMEAQRGKGLGTALLQHLTRSAAVVRSQIQIAVTADNLPALRLYQALGFRHYASMDQVLILRLSC